MKPDSMNDTTTAIALPPPKTGALSIARVRKSSRTMQIHDNADPQGVRVMANDNVPATAFRCRIGQ
jgi:hypothetical protein